MMRRQPKSRKEQQGLLLSQEEAPMLSDDLSDKTDDPHSSKSKKAGGWRSRLFGSSNGSNSNNHSNATRSTGRAVSAGRSSSRKASRKVTGSASRGLQQGPTPDLVQVSSSSSSGPERERPARPSAPLRTRPEHRDEQSQQRKPVPSPAPAPIPVPVPEAAPIAPAPPVPEQSTKALQRTLSNQTQTRQLTKSSSQSSQKSDRSKLLPSQSRSPIAPSGAVARVLKRPFGRETARPQDHMVRGMQFARHITILLFSNSHKTGSLSSRFVGCDLLGSGLCKSLQLNGKPKKRFGNIA